MSIYMIHKVYLPFNISHGRDVFLRKHASGTRIVKISIRYKINFITNIDLYIRVRKNRDNGYSSGELRKGSIKAEQDYPISR